jgi:hypothetical protein
MESHKQVQETFTEYISQLRRIQNFCQLYRMGRFTKPSVNEAIDEINKDMPKLANNIAFLLSDSILREKFFNQGVDDDDGDEND